MADIIAEIQGKKIVYRDGQWTCKDATIAGMVTAHFEAFPVDAFTYEPDLTAATAKALTKEFDAKIIHVEIRKPRKREPGVVY